jgi:putative membrane protein
MYPSKTVLALSICAAMSMATAAAQGSGSSNSSQSSHSSMSQTSNTGLSPLDEKFMQNAAKGNNAEVELGRLAVEKGGNSEVKSFGQRMIDDHTKANDQLKQLASRKNVNLSEGLSIKAKAEKKKLEGLSGADFDREYMADMLKDHRSDITDFRRESQAGTDPAVKHFASETLPTLRDHLKQAENIAPKETASNR